MMELVVVVVVITVVMVIAIPRISRILQSGPESAVSADWAVLCRGIDLYTAEHNCQFPTKVLIAEQLMQYTHQNDGTSSSKMPTHIYGLYVCQIPSVPLGPAKGSTEIITTPIGGENWLDNENNGKIRIELASA